MSGLILVGCSNTSLAQAECKGPWRDAADAAVSGGEVKSWAVPGPTKYRDNFLGALALCDDDPDLICWQLCERVPGLVGDDLYTAAASVLAWMRTLTDAPIFVAPLPTFDPLRPELTDCGATCARLVADGLAYAGPDFASVVLTSADLKDPATSAHTTSAGSRKVAVVLDAFVFVVPEGPPDDPPPDPPPTSNPWAGVVTIQVTAPDGVVVTLSGPVSEQETQ